jgi:AbiV family abortive infection protein
MTDPNFFINGYHLAVENADVLFNVATKAAEDNNFGVACSLNILSAEEAIKAVFLISKHNYPNSEITDFQEVFKDHKIKHKNLKSFLGISKKHIDNIFEMYSIFLKVEELSDFLPEDRKKKLKEEFSDIHYHGQRISKLKENEIDLAEALNWLDTANNDKNNGFYVGIRNDTWQTPKNFDKTKYEKERNYAVTAITHAKELDEIFKAIEPFKVTKNLR